MDSRDYIKSKMYGENKKANQNASFSPLFWLSKLYGFAVNLREVLYKKNILKERKIDSYVISVGNVVVGGTGKTPTVIYIAELLKKRGYNVCVLCRGYKGNNKKSVLEVSDGVAVLADPQTAGDEPYMLAKKLHGVPVIIGKNRYLAGKYAVEKFNPDVCILDDGFQHFKLKRDLNVVTFDGDVGFGNGNLLPNGILREPLSALKRADILIINKGLRKSEEIISSAKEHRNDLHIFFCGYDTVGLTSWSGESEDISCISGKRVLAFSAIANANYFYEIITRLGGSICRQIEYKDHHNYSIDDYFKIVKSAYDLNADFVVTTEKDIVKFDRAWGKDSKIKIFSLDVRLKPLATEEADEH